MSNYESRENYLVAIYVLSKKTSEVHPVEISEMLNFKLPSVSHMMSVLAKDKLVLRKENGTIMLTCEGKKIAEKLHQKRCFFKKLLINAGVDKGKAEKEACRMEHALSDSSFEMLQELLKRVGILYVSN